MRNRLRRSPLLALALIAAFVAGQVSAGTQFATSINKGLVNAFSSVGQNLFGEAAFESRFVPPNPIFPAGSVQLFMASDVELATGMNVFVPPNPTTPGDPCRVAIQIRSVPTNSEAPLQVVIDPDVMPGGSDVDLVYDTLASYRPSLARCEQAADYQP
ncbi:MAG: hypothetical protein FJ091_02115 [Deltaproteobacteria bacterium]|nr:hypothetical protein [Deltaproteobacteria bacterium]